jgi:plastocyanin
VRFRRSHLLAVTAFLAGLSLAVVPTLGADEAVKVGGGGNDVFSPQTVTVSAGQKVTWTNAGGTHNVKFDDGSYEEPPSPGTGWTESRTFPVAGTYTYYCEQHVDQGMTGTVVVTPASTTAPGPPGGGPGGGPAGTLGDTVPPKLTLSVSTAQRILRRRGLVVEVRVDEQATVSASARIATSGASRVVVLEKATRRLAPNARARLKLKLPRRARAAIASALARRSRLQAKVKVVAEDAAGNVRTSKRTVAVKK